MILDSFLRIIQIWTRNAASHLSMEWWRRKQGSRIYGFCFSLKEGFSSAKQSRIFFLKLWIQRFFYFPKEIACSEQFWKFLSKWWIPGECFQPKEEFLFRRILFSSEMKKNFELKYFTSLKIVHTFTLTNTYIMFCTVFLDRVFAFSLFLPKTSFCLKIVDECKAPTYTGNRLLFNTK